MTTVEKILLVLGATVVLVIGLLFLGAALAWVPHAHAHDIWINKGSYKNPAGEWCCGAKDCGVMSLGAVKAINGGYSVRGNVNYGAEITGDIHDGPSKSESVDEIIPYSQSLPSPDGSYWRCKRLDGSARCFFAPPPGS